MTITPSYNANPLAPKVLIYDLDDVLQYTYESSQIAASPTQNFNLRSLSLHLGINDDYGNASLIIDDPSALLVDTTINKASKIKRQWRIRIDLGKDSSTLNTWFNGKIMDAEVIRPDTNLQQIRLTCSGWGIRLKDRLTNIKRFQAKTADGISLDSTDTAARTSELLKDVIQDTDHSIIPTLSAEANITVTGVDTIDIKLANFQQNYQTFSEAMSQLAASSGAYYGIDPDRDLFFRKGIANDSGFLFTNNLDGLDAQGWSSTKIGYLFKQPFIWTDSTIDSGYSYLYGLGADVITLDVTQTSANATLSSHLKWYAFPFTPTSETQNKIALSLAKTGTPSSAVDENIDFRIIGQDGSATPNISDLRKQLLVNKIRFDALTGTGTWQEFAFDNIKVTPRTQLFLVAKLFGNVTNTFVMDYQTGSGTYYDSDNGSTWTSRVGNVKIRTYVSNPIIISLEDTTAKKKFGVREKLINFRETIQEQSARKAMILMSDSLCKEKRLYSKVAVSPPTDRIPLGKYCRFQDSLSGLDITAEITGIDVEMRADDQSNIGARFISLTLQDFHY